MSRVDGLENVNSKTKGVIFCQVDRIRQRTQEREFITLGNQKWHGAIPAFIISDRQTIERGINLSSFGTKKDRVIPRRKNLPPQHWARKYLIAASLS